VVELKPPGSKQAQGRRLEAAGLNRKSHRAVVGEDAHGRTVHGGVEQGPHYARRSRFGDAAWGGTGPVAAAQRLGRRRPHPARWGPR
jgi:hypothetical protein